MKFGWNDMWRNYPMIVLVCSIIIGTIVSGSYQSAMAQEPSNLSSNNTNIMQNTSGVVDDAFDALKDSFGSFFGGN